MPTYTIPSHDYNLRRDTVILDTNVLVAAFLPTDQHHDDARTFIEEWEEPFVVPLSVLVETWGMLVGSNKYWEGGIELLVWLSTPGNAELIAESPSNLQSIRRMISTIHVDCVDALLVHLADDVSKQCQLNPHMKIATYDTRDVMNCRMKNELHLTVLDLRSFEIY
jgi:predicted nucleic acid-binding protein